MNQRVGSRNAFVATGVARFDSGRMELRVADTRQGRIDRDHLRHGLVRAKPRQENVRKARSSR
jgi:hypothetical protein